MKTFVILIGMILVISSASFAQLSQEIDKQPDNQFGLNFAMAESGSAVGAFIAWPLWGGFHFGFGLDAYFLRDSKQFDYIDYYGYPISYNKQNNVYLFDAMINLKKRLFAEDLDESLRPFISAGAGPVYGINYPEYSVTEEGLPTQFEKQLTVGGYLGAGVSIHVNEKVFMNIQGQYRIIPFKDVVGERANHSMFELRFELGRRY